MGSGGRVASSRQISIKLTNQLHRYSNFSMFPRWRPSAILDLFEAHLDHPRSVLGDLYRCAKFGCDRGSSFDNMKVPIFRAFGLKTPIHAPKCVFFARFDLLNGVNINKTHKRHILEWSHVFWRILRQNRCSGLGCRRLEETKNPWSARQSRACAETKPLIQNGWNFVRW